MTAFVASAADGSSLSAVGDAAITVNEIFYSIQGESYLAGLPCVFIRLTGCHQRCVYCDTAYAFHEGRKMSLTEIIAAATEYPVRNALITGGEPLLQDNCAVLAEALLSRGWRVAVETGGSRDIGVMPRAVVKIMDIKTPGSGEMHHNNLKNLAHLNAKDEIKFVVTDPTDADWSLKLIRERNLTAICHVSLSPVDRSLLTVLAEKVLAIGLPVRVQYQLHKLIWEGRERGY